MPTLVLTDTQQVDLSIQPVDKHGHPAPVDGVPVWDSSDASILTVTPAADGLSAVAVAVAPGTAQVNVTADADLGAGTVPISGVLDVQVNVGTAVSVNINAGTPTEQP